MFTHLLANDPCFKYNFPGYLLDMEMNNEKEYNTFRTQMIIPRNTYLESCYSRTRVKIFGGEVSHILSAFMKKVPRKRW